MAKNSSTAQNGSNMDVVMVEGAEEVIVVLMALKKVAGIEISSFFPREAKQFFFLESLKRNYRI